MAGVTLLGGPSVFRLFIPSGPAAIIRGVAAIVINSVKALSFRSWPHVGVEARKVFPTRADLYSTTAVVRIVVCILIAASVTHQRPDPILSGVTHAVGLAASYYFLALKAPAANGSARVNGKFPNYNLSTAIATESPHVMGSPCSFDCCQPPVSTASNVFSEHGAPAAPCVSGPQMSANYSFLRAAVAPTKPHGSSVRIVSVSRKHEKRSEPFSSYVQNRHGVKYISFWYTQVGARADRLIKQLIEGQWQPL